MYYTSGMGIIPLLWTFIYFQVKFICRLWKCHALKLINLLESNHPLPIVHCRCSIFWQEKKFDIPTWCFSLSVPLCFMSVWNHEWWVATPPQRGLGKSNISGGCPWTSEVLHVVMQLYVFCFFKQEENKYIPGIAMPLELLFCSRREYFVSAHL